MKKEKFKVGDRVELTSSSLSSFFPEGTKFRVEKVDGEEIKVQRDSDGILYRGHEDIWKKVVSGLTPDERYETEARVKKLEEGIEKYLMSYPLAHPDELRQLVEKRRRR